MRAMKDSGIEWIGEIPEDWVAIKIGRIGNFTSSGINKKILENEPKVKIINYTDVYRNKNLILDNSIEYMTVTCAEEKIKEHLVNIGDLIFTPSSETIEEIGMSALVVEELENTAYSYHVLRFRANKKLFLNYKKYLCNNHYVYNVFSSRATGTIRQTLDRNDFKTLEVLLPPLPEQQTIADYLDRKCALIDNAIEKQKAVIEKLKQYKQSVITEAVTKGLNPNAPMKDSGIEWIGQIPEGWGVRPLFTIFQERKCKNYNNKETNLLSLSYGNIIKKDASNNMGLLPESFESYNIVEKSNIVFRLTDLQNDHVSLRSGIVLEKGIITSAYVTIEKIVEINALYYNYLFRSYDLCKVFYNMGGGVRQGLNYYELKKLLVLVPKITEQNLIANYIDNECAKIDNLIENKQKWIEKLEEYKKSLIYECVTGKREIISS